MRSELHRYPKGVTRAARLGLVLLVVAVLYYELLFAVALTPRILVGYRMSYGVLIDAIATGFILGGVFGAATGLTDRFGRTNVISVGALIAGLLCLLGIPVADTQVEAAVVFGALGLVEGVLLVASVAYVRDLTPRAGRATGMAVWALGPAAGAIGVSVHVRETAGKMAFEDYYTIAGAAGVVVAGLAALFLRDLAVELRAQVIRTRRDRPVLMARARTIDVDGAQLKAVRRTARWRVLVPATGIGLLLVAYWAGLVFLPTFFDTVLSFSADAAQGLAVWMWGANGVALLVFGVLSDRLGVRKPFLLIGAAGAITCTVLLALRTTHTYTDYQTFHWLLAGLGASFGAVLGPWLAGFSETVEDEHPALVATGFGAAALIGRILIAAALIAVPIGIGSTNVLLDKAPTLKILADGGDPTLNSLENKAVEAGAKNPGLGVKAQRLAPKYATELDLVPKLTQAVATAVKKKPKDVDAQAGALAKLTGLAKTDIVTVLKTQSKYKKELKIATSLDSDTLANLLAHPTDKDVVKAAARKLVGALKITDKAARKKIRELNTAPANGVKLVFADSDKIATGQTTLKQFLKIPADVLSFFAGNNVVLREPIVQERIAYLAAHRPEISDARAAAPKQWRTYLFVAAGAEVLFVPTIFLLGGYWLPWRARRALRASYASADADVEPAPDGPPGSGGTDET